MYTFIVILIIIVCVLLALVVLVQNSKGGGLAANFSAPTQVLGARQSADFIEKATWWLAIILVVLCLVATVSIPHRNADGGINTEVTTSAEAPVTSPVAPAATPAPTADQQ
ncbi:MAG: preprotein translocase subunit SecG [Bacteroidales bacterium]|nr:preprotein translocase subunit SecG [Bacteroidales bacterium]